MGERQLEPRLRTQLFRHADCHQGRVPFHEKGIPGSRFRTIFHSQAFESGSDQGIAQTANGMAGCNGIIQKSEKIHNGPPISLKLEKEKLFKKDGIAIMFPFFYIYFAI
jgi:hypothetical protein